MADVRKRGVFCSVWGLCWSLSLVSVNFDFAADTHSIYPRLPFDRLNVGDLGFVVENP